MNIENNQLIGSSMAELVRGSLGLTVIALGLCGFLYSSVATGLGQTIFPDQANGSMMIENNQIVGSSLVAQPFTQVQYFHPRPSAANYDPMAMAGSNMARTNPELNKTINERLNKISVQEQIDPSKIPADLVTASGSGIDPEISVQSAMIQAKRIAQARHLADQDVIKLVQEQTVQPTFGVLGQARVNVLELNLALDRVGK
ncbi:potassium-transporting ATPase subunit KdpC [Acinetobacter wuhouensis]|uniref:Potassium-transporting ATPase KdpC subunit n=1 Tax=Acinetobacter wuhouensis TaxID=1879050 RepID=A0A4Q7ADU3_9GAMM|nr:potassium-transporting ATPase subunit KdpC [Acinetobacter wuhouensis]RZG44696.1 potassium-transporting ATPase subunit KdpC [Acinetobacter wuhouensis]RZG71311.1 potassium-transporting ATPase subunit KdpC [Acinetobacter wuhouensis]